MARALSSCRALFAVLPNGITAMICRGYSAAAALEETAGRRVMAEEKEAVITGKEEEIEAASSESIGVTPWVPDPVTGYYRPANVFREVDPAELRQELLKEKI